MGEARQTPEEARLEKEHEFLDSAKSFEWAAVKAMLRETPGLINVQPCGRWTALHQAAFEGNGGVAKQLLDLGADSAARNRAGQTPADVAKGSAKEVLVASREGAAAAEAAAPVAEPPAKKAKKEKVRTYHMNINEAVDKEYWHCSLSEIAAAPTSALRGIAGRGQEILKKLGVKTVRQLGKWKFYRMAKGIAGFSSLEQEGQRAEGSALNVDNALDKKHESKSLSEVAALPPSALQGIADWADEELAKLHIKTIADLGHWKFAQWAEWITDLAEFEVDDK